MPSDFAARTPRVSSASARIANESVEMWLERGLVALLLVAGIAALLVLPRRLVDRVFVQRAGARRIRHPDGRELESRDRGLRRDVLGVRARSQALVRVQRSMDPIAHTFAGMALAAAGLRRATPLAATALFMGVNAPDVDVFSGFFGPTTNRSRSAAVGLTASWRWCCGRSC